MTEYNLYRHHSAFPKHLSPIEIGKIIPIIEHINCFGAYGTVIDVQPGSIIKVRCNTCRNSRVIVDTKTIYHTHR